MQKTADEMRISDWSSDVCSSDLTRVKLPLATLHPHLEAATFDKVDRVQAGDFVIGIGVGHTGLVGETPERHIGRGEERGELVIDRKSVVSGKSVYVRVDLGGRRIIKHKIIYEWSHANTNE